MAGHLRQDIRMHHQTSTFSCATLLAAFLAITTGAVARDASKQDSAKAVPTNARANQFGSGWECKPGFRQEGAACAAIKLPENAYLSDDSFGPGRACNGHAAISDRLVVAKQL
jgi:hypothetical protein